MENQFLKIENNKIVFVIHRKIIEAKNYLFVLNIFDEIYKDNKTIREFKNRLKIQVDGFDTESQKIFEINLVRNYIQQLTQEFPYWYYFLSIDDDSLWTMMLILCKFQQTDPRHVKVNRHEFHIVSTFLLRNLYKFYDQHGLPKGEIKPLRRRIEKYISKFQRSAYEHYLEEEGL